MISIPPILKGLARFLNRLQIDRRGNVLMIMGFAIIPLTMVTGMAVDFARAARLQTKLNAAADAAALMAVSKPSMTQTNDYVKTKAKAMFSAQAIGLPGLTFDPADLVVTVTGNVGASNSRTVVVSYTAQSQNAFGGVLRMNTIEIGGSSTATSSQAPNIDFYLLLDTSPSMLLPATSAGLASLTAATGGCAFACHQTNVTYSSSNKELSCNSKKTVCIDYYRVARNNSLILRTDLVTEAVQNLTDVATSTGAENGANYRMGIADFDYMYRQIYPTLPTGGYWVDNNLANVKAHVADAKILPYCINNQRVCGTNDNDMATNFTAAFNGSLATMPTSPGDGTNVSGDTPQAILFIITDGMRDENVSGSRAMGPIPSDQCTTIKNRGIRIAILNTQYLPESASDSWSITNVKTPYLSPTDKVSPALVACASPGLYYQVTTDGNISAALAGLFQKAVSTAHLTN